MNILVVGSINMDLVLSVDHIARPGETILSNGYERFFGGKGANQAVAAAQLGANVSFIGAVGEDDFGSTILEHFQQKGLNTEGIKQAGQTGTAMIQVSKDGENSIVLVPGANHALTVEDIANQEQLFEACDLLLVQLEVPLPVIEKAVEVANAKGKTVVVNPAPAQVLTPQLLQNVDFLTPNEHELALLSGQKIDSLEGVVIASRSILSQGVKHVITTLGGKGSVHVTSDSYEVVESEQLQPVDTTGAGDAYNAGFATGILSGLSIADAMKLATKVSRIVILKEGAQPPIPAMKDI
ncbi:ribokinase [Radiobacillus kanasensis]|uniref:ribokinase n=1 Tax=Radiobacillus kanasensis TaxID=2844358 RepID=UPI001E4ECD33|nr:ribokinase [Radiobacillus kanasensis]UFT98697.1 ribokinase [Radiobacillus kanasensis]